MVPVFPQYLQPRPGRFVSIEDGTVMGTHKGGCRTPHFGPQLCPWAVPCLPKHQPRSRIRAGTVRSGSVKRPQFAPGPCLAALGACGSGWGPAEPPSRLVDPPCTQQLRALRAGRDPLSFRHWGLRGLTVPLMPRTPSPQDGSCTRWARGPSSQGCGSPGTW